VREGLLFILDDDVPFPQVLTELSERINAKPDFFRGAGITINGGRRVMDRPDFDVVYRMLTRNGMHVLAFVSLSAQSRMVAEGYGVPSRPPSFAAGDAGGSLGLKSRGTASAMPHPPGGQQTSDSATERASERSDGLFLRCNLRPGQSVRYPGDVCVLGNVEAGAEVVADGDIVVWGALMGTAHAGANGDDEAVICALRLAPQQLGIAGYTSRFPAREPAGPWPAPPELARVESGQLVIEAWSGE
jgi:septum site-determining protein MinC